MDNRHNLIDETAMESFGRCTKTCIFRFYYSILSTQFSMNVLYILIITIEALQIICLSDFNVLYSGMEYNKTSVENILSISNAMKYVYQLYPGKNYLVSSIILYFLISVFTLQFGFYIYFKKREINYKSTSSILRGLVLRLFLLLNILYQEVLTIPIWTTFFTFFQCTSGGVYTNFPDTTCASSTYYINLGLSVFGSLQFFIISYLNCEFLADSRPISILPYAAPKNKIPYLKMTVKLLLAFFYVFKFTENDTPMFDIKIVSILIILTLILIFRFFNHFFYHNSVGGFTIVYEGAFLFNAIFSLINKYINTVYSLQFIIVQLLTSLFFGYLIFLFIDDISENIIHSNINTITSDHQAHYKLLLLLNFANSFKEDTLKKNTFLGLLQKHRLKCYSDKCSCHSYIRILNQSRSSESKASFMIELFLNRKEKKKKVVLDGATNTGNINTHKGEADKLLKSQNRKSNGNLTGKLLRRRKDSKNISENSVDHYSVRDGEVSQLNESDEMQEDNDNGREVNELSIDDCIYGTVKIYLETLIKNFPSNSDLNVFYAYLMTYYMNNIYKALFELMKVYKRKTTFSRQFEIFFLQCEIEKIMYRDYMACKDEDFHIENVLTYNDIVNQVLELMNQTAHETILFWTEVGVKPPGQETFVNNANKNKSLIYEHAMNIGNNIKKMKTCYTILSDSVKFRNKIILKLYCLFLEKIIFNEHEGIEIRDRLKAYDRDNLGHMTKHIYHEDHLSSFVNMDEVGTVVISGNLHDIGKVLIVNHLFCSIFKHERDEINKHSINKCIPAYMAQYHDGFIKRYLETAKKHILDRIRMVFGISSVGLLTPILLHVKIIPNLEESIRFIGLTKKMRKTHPFFQVPETELNGYVVSPNSKDISFIMCNEKGKVFGITKPAMKQYGIPLNVLYTNMSKAEDQGQGKELNIKNLIPNVDEEAVDSQMKSENGCILKLDTRFLKSAFEDFKEALQEGNSEILKSLKKFSAGKAFGEHIVLVFCYDISFDDGQVPAKIYKILNVTPKVKETKHKFNEESGFSFHNNNMVNIGAIGSITAANNANQSGILSKASGVSNRSRPNDKLTHNIFQKTHSKGIVEMTTSLEPNDNDNDDKNEIASMRRGNIFSLIGKNNENEENNQHRELIKFKRKLNSVTIPKQVKTFIVSVGILIFILLLIGIAEFFLTTSNLYSLNQFISMWENYNERNLRFASIILYTRVLMLLDNNILTVNDMATTRSLIVSKLKIDLNKTISLNNELIYPLNNIDSEIAYINNIQQLYTLNLGETFDIYYREANLGFVIDFILVKIATLLESGNLSVVKPENLFYYNENFTKSATSPEILRDLFYIIENAISPVRFWIENVEQRINLMLSTKVYFNTTARDIICYLPFLFIILAFVAFCVVLSRINDYKLKILRVFFLVDKSYGMRIVKRCNKFLDNSHNFLRNSKLNIETYLDDKDEDIVRYYGNSNKLNTGHTSGKVSANTQNQDNNVNFTIASIRTMNSNNLLNPTPEDNTGIASNNLERGSSKDNFSSGGLSPFGNRDINSPSSFAPLREKKMKRQKTIQNRASRDNKENRENKDKDRDKVNNSNSGKGGREGNNKKNKKEGEDFLFNSELEASKSSFRRSLCLIYFKLTVLILIVAVYFAIIISINLNFNSSIFDNSTKISLYANRGWSFNNYLIYFQEMIMQNKDSGYLVNNFNNYSYIYTFEGLNVVDYFNLYYNQSFSIENSIVLLNAQVNQSSPTFLNADILLDDNLNSNQYCAELKAYDPQFYSQFQSDCECFYTQNLGIRDNIGLISGYLKSNPPNYYNQSFQVVSEILTDILPYVNHTELFINQAILMEMNTLYSSFSAYVTDNINSSIIRSVVYILLLVCELLIFLYVTSFLSRMLNKDRTILTIIPNEAIFSSEKVRMALNNLRTLN